MRKILSIFILQFVFCLSYSQEIPDGYYDETDGLTGVNLKVKLHEVIRNHRVRTYSEFRDIILPDLDEDPDNPNNIILFYKNNSISKDDFASNNEEDFWNREHTWPSSHGFSDDLDTAYTDVHNLRPSDATVNSSKSNKDFNDIENITKNEEGEAPETYTDSDFWEPRDEIKGDVARILFYMATRYESESLDLELVDRISYSGDPELGVLFTMLEWHENDPVDQYEIDRHEGAYGYQENRNPFIDHPEWVGEIWGASSETLLLFDQYAFNTDFGTVAIGSSASQVYDVNAYNLSEDVEVSVESPFSVSLDGVSYTNTIILVDEESSNKQTYSVYLKYAPILADEEVEIEVVHNTGEYSKSFEVEAKEGDVSVLSIADARSLSLGEVVSVSGVIIDGGNNSSNSRVLYDGTAGIVVRSFDDGHESANLSIGDSILVKGGLSEYGNVLQIEESPITIELLKSDAILPSPKLITISEVGEVYESQLVTIEDVTFNESGNTFAGGGSVGNFNITDATGSMVFRVGSSSHPLVGTEIPAAICDITGFVGQFFGSYQLSVRYIEDIVIGNSSVVDNTLFSRYGLSNFELEVFPNPTKGYIIMDLPSDWNSYDVELKIIDFTGKVIDKFDLIESKVDVTHLQKGVYFLSLNHTGNTYFSRFIKL